jgi:hypothetical protein
MHLRTTNTTPPPIAQRKPTQSAWCMDVAINGCVGRGEWDALENGKDTLGSWKTRGESIFFRIESELLRDGIRCMLDSAFYAARVAIRCGKPSHSVSTIFSLLFPGPHFRPLALDSHSHALPCGSDMPPARMCFSGHLIRPRSYLHSASSPQRSRSALLASSLI